MKDLHNWLETIDQLAIFVAMVLKLLCFVLEELEDSIGGLAVLEFFGKRVLGQVYPGMITIFSQGCVENEMKV